MFVPEFFDGRSSSKNPRAYKYYRNAIIRHFGENPNRKITFTEARKTIVGDVGSIRRVFDFLEAWGLINYAGSTKPQLKWEDKETKSAASAAAQGGDSAAAGPDASATKRRVCNGCNTVCTFACFASDKHDITLCARCYVRGNYRVGLSSSYFKRIEISEETKTDWRYRKAKRKSCAISLSTPTFMDNSGVPVTILMSAAEGLKVLRENNLIHRDLKPQNLLLSSNGDNSVLKIADFGFARSLQPRGLAETLCGSTLYMAPEIMQLQKYDAKLLTSIIDIPKLLHLTVKNDGEIVVNNATEVIPTCDSKTTSSTPATSTFTPTTPIAKKTTSKRQFPDTPGP
ncbi:hypothetical protein CASFOL_037559 [Castilleja foliolosa]|uniref:Protein kinase domain-containing protein n=1 Tax=Castilleja foliolosa TaxID=1961234 RepID=A0ABD3BMH5_9LAMI